MNLGGLAGLSAAYPAFVKGRQDENNADLSDLNLQDAKRQALAKVAMGNALALLGGGQQQQGQGLPAPPPGQPSQPAGPPQGGMMPPQGGQPPMAGGAPPSFNERFGGQAPPGGMPGQPPHPMGRPPSPGGPGMMPPGGGPPGMGQPQMGGQPGGQQGPQRQGALDWRQLVTAVKQANPSLPPDVMAQAVTQFLPLMSQQSQMEWRALSLQMREQGLQQREQQFLVNAADRRDRETGRNERADQTDARVRDKEKGTQGRFDAREGRLADTLQFRKDSTWARLDQQKQQAEQRVAASQGKQGLAELRAAIDAQDKHVRTRIQAHSAANTMKPAERKQLLDQADADYNAQIEKLRSTYGRSTPTGGTTNVPGPKAQDRTPQGNPASPVTTQAPVQVQTPAEADKLKPGTKYRTPDGQEFTR